jgi:hypothetical protein
VEEEGFSRPTRCHDGQGGPVNTVFLPLFFLKQLKTFKSALYHDRLQIINDATLPSVTVMDILPLLGSIR